MAQAGLPSETKSEPESINLTMLLWAASALVAVFWTDKFSLKLNPVRRGYGYSLQIPSMKDSVGGVVILEANHLPIEAQLSLTNQAAETIPLPSSSLVMDN